MPRKFQVLALGSMHMVIQLIDLLKAYERVRYIRKTCVTNEGKFPPTL